MATHNFPQEFLRIAENEKLLKRKKRGHPLSEVDRKILDDNDVERVKLISHGQTQGSSASSSHTGVPMDGIVEDNTAVSDEMTELLALIDEPATRQTTFTNANKEEWDEVRQEISERFPDGMSVKHLRSLAERHESLHAFCAACNGDIRYGPAFHVDVISVDGMRTETLRLRRCESCPWKAASEPVDLVAYALWPVNARASAYFDFSYLLYIGVLQDLSPALSMGSILQALHLVSKLSCKNTFIMSQDALNYSLFEWRSAYDQHISSLIDVFNCPCCGDFPHAIHLDGNAKLYRYRKVASATHQEPEKNALFLSQSIVEEQVTRVTASQEQPESKMCGDSIWKAASSVGRKFSKKDETGVMLATCRHSLVLKALDMVKGEIYAYPYTLQVTVMYYTILPARLCAYSFVSVVT